MNPRDPNVTELSTAAIVVRDDLVIAADVSRDPPGYTIEDPLRGKFFRVGVAEYTFLSLLDGKTSFAEALGLAADKLGPQALAEHEALALCRWLFDSHLAHPANSDMTARVADFARRSENARLLSALNPLAIQLPLVHPDRILAAIVGRVGWLFSPGFAAVWCLAVLYAFYRVAADWSHLAEMSAVILDRDNWLRLAAGWIVLKVLHETAHGLMCKRYGGSVSAAGVTLLFFFPLAYVDVTSSWRFRSKWQRIATAAAGMYAELFVAALAVALWSATSPGIVHHMALNIAVTAGFTTLLFNGNPLVRFDGYFIVSDLLGIPNLYACSQQFIVDFVQKHLLGIETAVPTWPKGRGWLIRTYAVASLAWRVLFFLTLALALVGRYSYLGGVLAIGLLALAWGMPLVGIVRRTMAAIAGQSLDRRHAVFASMTAAVVIIAAAALLACPGHVEAPAVVEFAPPTVVRAATPGFVREVCVRGGQHVARGQVIAQLRNAELESELADLKLNLQQSIIRGRVHRQNDELAKEQIEAAQQIALRKKVAELEHRVDGLTVRASAAGRVVARDLDSLPGRYLQEGDEIAVLGQGNSKELVVAVPQDDVELFLAQQRLGKAVRIRSHSGMLLSARVARLEPRASNDLPHPALAANVGGPLPVKVHSPAEAEKNPATYELLTPVFTARVALSAEQAAELHAGELATVSFRTPAETVFARWDKYLRGWAEKYLASPTAG